MKTFQYGFKNNSSDYTQYMYIYAKTLESALKQAKKYIIECYGSDYRVVSIQEL